jgi:hypothetical protein
MPHPTALAEVRRAVADDPLNAWVVAMHSYMLGIAGQHEASVAEAERANALDAESFFSQWNLVRAHAWAGDRERALALAPGILADSGRHVWVLGLLAWIHGQADRPERAMAVADEMEGRSRHEYVSPFWLAAAASAAGRGDEAMRRVERAVSERDPLVLWSRSTPFWAAIRRDPRFEEALRPVWGGSPVGQRGTI